MITLSLRVLLARRNNAPLGRQSGSNNTKNNFELRFKSLLSTPEIALLMRERTCLHVGAIFCAYIAHSSHFERYIFGV